MGEEFRRLQEENRKKLVFLRLMRLYLQMQIGSVAFNNIEEVKQLLDVIEKFPNPCLVCPFRKEKRCEGS